MKPAPALVEESRIQTQIELDAAKDANSRNRLGQFSTPPRIAEEIVSEAMSYLDPAPKEISLLDPAIGTGVFYSKFLSLIGSGKRHRATGFEIDPHYGNDCLKLWGDFGLDLRLCSFLRATPPTDERERYDLVVCNPPYVRHHHLSQEDKKDLNTVTFQSTGLRLSGLAGLYCHFILNAQKWMKKNAIGIWIIPSEFMDVNYGSKVKDYLTSHVQLLKIHRYNPADSKFSDALVSSAVVVVKNAPPCPNSKAVFTFGGSLAAPEISEPIPVLALKAESKWTRFPQKGVRSKNVETPVLSDLFTVKRGIATGANDFFILSPDQIREHRLPKAVLTPVLPSPRLLKKDFVAADAVGNPQGVEPLFLLDCRLPMHDVTMRYPALADYLREGEKKVGSGYLCKSRKVWFHQEIRPPAPLICTYLGRTDGGKKPFRFILNESKAVCTNVYLLLYPTPLLEDLIAAKRVSLRKLWEQLNDLPVDALLDEGRVYGGGLHKLEPKELRRVRLDFLTESIGLGKFSLQNPT